MPKVQTIVFLSLILDLFAFTIPLPLFPRLIEWYTIVSNDLALVTLNRSSSIFFFAYRERALIPMAFSRSRYVQCPMSGACSTTQARNPNDGILYFLVDLWAQSSRA